MTDKKLETRQEADFILAALAVSREKCMALEGEAESKITDIVLAYTDRIDAAREQYDKLDAELIALAKKHKRELFDSDDCRLDLENGSLLFKLETSVKHNHDALEQIKAQGFSGGIKIEESVDWDSVATWPDEKLWTIGSKRQSKEKYEYELRLGRPDICSCIPTGPVGPDRPLSGRGAKMPRLPGKGRGKKAGK